MTTDQPEAARRDFGRDYEEAKRLVEEYGDGDTEKTARLAEGIRETRERGWYDPTPEQRLARTIIAERIEREERRRKGWPIPNTP